MLASRWSRVITWPRIWPLIGLKWSRDLDTVLWLVKEAGRVKLLITQPWNPLLAACQILGARIDWPIRGQDWSSVTNQKPAFLMSGMRLPADDVHTTWSLQTALLPPLTPPFIIPLLISMIVINSLLSISWSRSKSELSCIRPNALAFQTPKVCCSPNTYPMQSFFVFSTPQPPYLSRFNQA